MKYRIQLWKAVPDTNTSWEKLVSQEFTNETTDEEEVARFTRDVVVEFDEK